MSKKVFLVIGDIHVPDRVAEIPRQVKSFIESSQFDFVLSTGDLTSQEVLLWMKTIAPLKVVKGNMDYLPLPERETLQFHKFKIGLTHGSGIWPRGDVNQLLKMAKSMNVNVFISGHTHHPNVSLKENVLLLNPGSLTGAWGGSSCRSTPSLITLTMSGKDVTAALYTLEETLLSKRREEHFIIKDKKIVAL